jgi:hypothetical protein
MDCSPNVLNNMLLIENRSELPRINGRFPSELRMKMKANYKRIIRRNLVGRRLDIPIFRDLRTLLLFEVDYPRVYSYVVLMVEGLLTTETMKPRTRNQLMNLQDLLHENHERVNGCSFLEKPCVEIYVT